MTTCFTYVIMEIIKGWSSGGTGIHKGLKIPRPFGIEGSNPS